MSVYRNTIHSLVTDTPLLETYLLLSVADPQGNVMLSRMPHSYYWTLPGCCLDPNENILESLQRSILDNYSFLPEDCALLKVFSGADLAYLSEDKVRTSPIYMLFYPTQIRGSLRVRPRDGSEIRFFAPWNIPMDRVFPPMKRVFQYYIDHVSSGNDTRFMDWSRYPKII